MNYIIKMNTSKKIISIVMLVLFLITVSISLINRTIYGTWSVSKYPNRVSFGEYRYYIGVIVILPDHEKPQYEISRNIDRLTGKRIYSKEKDFVGCGKVVYLHLDNDRYLTLVSGGGG